MSTPGRLLAWFFALTLTPAMALGWVGWRLIEQDRILEQRRVQERREQAADLVVTALQQVLSSDAQRLADGTRARELARDDAHVVVFGPGRIEITPERPLVYYPIAASLPEASGAIFDAAEQDEFRFQNYDAAITKLRELTHSRDAAVRAGAALRLARNLKKAGRLEQALDVYGSVAQDDAVGFAGAPAALIARRARCALLADLKQSNELRREAEALNADLQRGRWKLDRAQYEHYSNEVAPWLDSPEAGSGDRLEAFAAVVERVFNLSERIRTNESSLTSGHELLQSDVLLWTAANGRVAALIAGPKYIKHQWIDPLQPLLASQSVRIDLNSTAPLDSGAESERRSGVTALPWTLRVANVDMGTALHQYASRRRLLLAGLALILGPICAGSYFVARAVNRELALARLQSDFVSAVSHEFRTPLTSLSQISEILTEGRVRDSQTLQRYYETQARATGRLQRLVESLLDFGRMEAGAKPYRLEPVDARDLVRSVVEEFRMNSNRLQWAATNEKVFVNADSEALAHAIRNLIDNAIKYSPANPEVGVELTRHDECVAIRVRDRGLGIPRSEQKEIFRKFVRGAASKEYGIKGTGVGLAMVKHIVDAHHGKIDLVSEPGQGSTFTISFPEFHVSNSDC